MKQIKTEVVTMRAAAKRIPTYNGLYLRLKAQFMIKLGYDSEKATEQAAKLARLYVRAFCNHKNQ
jgi:hypothetical protein